MKIRKHKFCIVFAAWPLQLKGWGAGKISKIIALEIGPKFLCGTSSKIFLNLLFVLKLAFIVTDYFSQYFLQMQLQLRSENVRYFVETEHHILLSVGAF